MSRKPRSGELSRTELWATTAIGMGTGLLPFIITGYISYYFTNVALIPASALVTIMFAARLFDAVQDIGIGTVLDRVRRPDGQCRPFYKWFALPYFIFAALLFLNPPLGATGKVIYAFVTYVGALFMVSFLQLPHSAQISLLTKDSKEISTICSMRSITSSVVIVLFGLVLIPMLKAFGGGNMDRGFLPVGVIVGALGAASAVWSYFGTKDRHVAPPPKKEKIPVIGQLRYLKNGPWIIGLIIVLAVMLSYSFSSSMAIYYFKYVVPNELLAGIALVLLYIFIIPGSIVAPLLGEKLGRKRAIICGILSSVAGKLIMLLGSTGFVFAGLAMSGLGLGVALPLLTTLMPDIVDYGEWKSGTSTPGILYSALGLGSKMGSGLAVSVQLFILAASGFNADLTVQPPSAVSAIALSYIAVPLVCDLLALLAIHFYRIDRIRDQILQELDQQHAAQQELSAQQA